MKNNFVYFVVNGEELHPTILFTDGEARGVKRQYEDCILEESNTSIK